MGSKEEEMMEAIAQMGENLSDDVKKGLENVIKNMFEHGMVPQDAFGVNKDTVENYYSQAYQLYNTGKYVEASRLFRFLIVLNATDPRYALGLAACFHMLKEYENAVEAYMNCAFLDKDSPVPHYHASDCYLKMNDPLSALIALKMAIKRAGDKPEYAVLKDRAVMTMEGLNKEVNKKSLGGAK